MNNAIDTVRRDEVLELKHTGRPAWLTRARWLLPRRRDHRTTQGLSRLRDLVRLNLKAVRSMLLREEFEPFWLYRSAHWAGRFLGQWCTQRDAVAHRPDEGRRSRARCARTAP